jgi:hypothetical protein
MEKSIIIEEISQIGCIFEWKELEENTFTNLAIFSRMVLTFSPSVSQTIIIRKTI